MGTIQALRLTMDSGMVTFAVMGMDTYPIGGGHMNSFNYVEVSAASLPAL